jgi:hypothetical protein
VSTQAFLGFIPLIKRLLFNPSSLSGCCAHEMNVQRQEEMAPNGGGPPHNAVAAGCIPGKGPILDAAGSLREEGKKLAILRHPCPRFLPCRSALPFACFGRLKLGNPNFSQPYSRYEHLSEQIEMGRVTHACNLRLLFDGDAW